MSFPAVPTIDELEFYKLTWPQFERLCRDLVASHFQNLQNVREYLSQGHKQDGIDIRGFDPNDGRYLYIQCKKEKSFTAKDIENAISLFESGEFFEDSKAFILCVISRVNKNHEDVIKKTEKEFQKVGKEFIIWDGVALTNILREQSQIVYDLFGPHYALNFCGAERYKKIIIRPEVKKFPAPENYVPRLLLYPDKIGDKLLRISLIDSLEGIGNHILIKSEPTIGKTTELKFIAHYYSVIKKDVFFPVLISLKNYVSQLIEELLVAYFSEDWKKG